LTNRGPGLNLSRETGVEGWDEALMGFFEPGRRRFRRSGARRRALAAALVAALLAGIAHAGAPPPPAYDRPRPPAYDPPPVVVAPPVAGVVVARRVPPPLPIGLRIVYAPFYLTGLVLRYGVYYALVAPLEVLGRTLTYGADGGVARDHQDR
jgi:hypothetical protein